MHILIAVILCRRFQFAPSSDSYVEKVWEADDAFFPDSKPYTVPWIVETRIAEIWPMQWRFWFFFWRYRHRKSPSIHSNRKKCPNRLFLYRIGYFCTEPGNTDSWYSLWIKSVENSLLHFLHHVGSFSEICNSIRLFLIEYHLWHAENSTITSWLIT